MPVRIALRVKRIVTDFTTVCTQGSGKQCDLRLVICFCGGLEGGLRDEERGLEVFDDAGVTCLQTEHQRAEGAGKQRVIENR